MDFILSKEQVDTFFVFKIMSFLLAIFFLDLNEFSVLPIPHTILSNLIMIYQIQQYLKNSGKLNYRRTQNFQIKTSESYTMKILFRLLPDFLCLQFNISIYT